MVVVCVVFTDVMCFVLVVVVIDTRYTLEVFVDTDNDRLFIHRFISS